MQEEPCLKKWVERIQVTRECGDEPPHQTPDLQSVCDREVAWRLLEAGFTSNPKPSNSSC